MQLAWRELSEHWQSTVQSAYREFLVGAPQLSAFCARLAAFLDWLAALHSSIDRREENRDSYMHNEREMPILAFLQVFSFLCLVLILLLSLVFAFLPTSYNY